MFNRQRKLPVEIPTLRDYLRQVSERLGIHAPFSVVLISDRAMQSYNRRYASKNHTTDVLSFPADGEGMSGEEDYLGDILISVEAADRQKKATLAREIELLCLHGLLHLLGFDHEADSGEMEQLELRLRAELGLAE